MQDEELTGLVIGCAMKVQRKLGPGFLESVYETALAHELGKAGLAVELQRPLQVVYDDVVVGEFVADMVVEGRLLVENKAVHELAEAHEVQVVNYLAATGLDVGLLFNFGAERLEHKRKHRVYRPRREAHPRT
jgi:GxxExxY protein